MHIVESASERVGGLPISRFDRQTDGLTGLPNEAAFRIRAPQIVESTLARGETGFIAMVDLNGLQAVNDALGQGAGDRILRSVAGMLEEIAGKNGMAARIGNDEFVVITQAVKRRSVAQEMAALHDKVCGLWPRRIPFESKGISVGLAWFPEEGISLGMLMVHADFRMHIDKRNKRTQRMMQLEETRETVGG